MWESALDGRRLRFHLAGINNQNFIMQDDETGTWWQQVNGRAILGPMKGRRLKLIPADIVAFGVWKTDHPNGRVLAPDPEVEARGDDYIRSDWERSMARRRVVTTLPKGSAFEPRTLVVGVTVNGHAKAYALDDLRGARVLLDVIDDRPVLIAVADDGTSVRVFDRRIDGAAVEFAATPIVGRYCPGDPRQGCRATGSASGGSGYGERVGFCRPCHQRADGRPDADAHPASARVLVRLADLLAEDGVVQAVETHAEGNRSS